MAVFNWNAAVSGNFGNAAMWTGPGGVHVVPGPSDDASTPGGSYTITVTSTTTVNSFNGGASLDVASGAFVVNNAINLPSSIISNLTVEAGATFATQAQTTTLFETASIAGRVNVGAGATLNFSNTGNGANLLAGATLTGPGTFLVNSGLVVASTVTAPTNLVLDAGNSIGIDGPGTLTIPSGATLDWRSGYMYGVGGTTNVAAGGRVLLGTSGTKLIQDRAFNNAGAATWSGGTLEIDGQGVFTNSGTITVQSDSPLSGTGAFTNTGSLTKTSPSGVGTTFVTATYHNSGTTVGQSGIFQIDGPGIDTGVFNIPSASGSINVTGNGYNINPGATVTGPGTLRLTTGSLGTSRVNLNTTLTVPNLAVDNAILSGAGSLTVPGTMSMANGTVAITGTLTLPLGSNLNMFGASQSSTFNRVTVNDSGTTTLSGTESFALVNAATFNNAGIFTIQNDTVGGAGVFDLGGATFNNTGTLVKTTSAGFAGASTVGNGTFLNRGRVTVGAGRLLLDTVGTNTAILDASAGAALTLGRAWSLEGGTSFTGLGAFGVGNGLNGFGTITVNANLSSPNFAIPGGNLVVAQGATFTLGRLNFLNGMISGPGTVAIASGGTLTFANSSDKTISGSTLAISGVANWIGTGNIDLNSGAVINLNAGGTFNASNDQSINASPTEVFNVSGTFVKTSLTGVGTTTINSTANILPGGVLNVASGNLSTASLVNVGMISLGSQTVLNVAGTYTQPNAGILNVAIGGTTASGLFGQLRATSTGSLNGTLNATLVNGFTPIIGQPYPVVSFASRTGNFTTFNPPRVGSSPYLSSSPTSTGLNLVSMAILPSAPVRLAIFAPDATGGAGVTSNRQPRLIGQATPGILVQVYDQNRRLYASAIAGSDGTFIAVGSAPLAVGNYTFTPVSIDALSNFSPFGTPLNVSITIPAAPTNLTIFPADANRGANATSLTQPRLVGQATVGYLVQLFEANGAFFGSAFADGSGMFVIVPASRLTLGSHVLKAVAIDPLGNYGNVSTSYTFNVVA